MNFDLFQANNNSRTTVSPAMRAVSSPDGQAEVKDGTPPAQQTSSQPYLTSASLSATSPCRSPGASSLSKVSQFFLWAELVDRRYVFPFR